MDFVEVAELWNWPQKMCSRHGGAKRFVRADCAWLCVAASRSVNATRMSFQWRIQISIFIRMAARNFARHAYCAGEPIAQRERR